VPFAAYFSTSAAIGAGRKQGVLRMKKVLLGVALVIVLAIAGGAWWFYSSVDALMASAIRSYGPDITGVSVKLSSLKIAPADGSVVLRGLMVGNPKGFTTDRALAVGEMSMVIDIASLTRDVVLIRKIAILSPEITYEYAAGGSNIDVIQRNVDRYVAEHLGANDKTGGKGPGKKLIIENLAIRGCKINVSAAALNGKAMTLDMPAIQMHNIGTRSNGATTGEVVQQVMGAVTHNAKSAVSHLNLGGAVDKVKEGTGAVGDKIKGLFK
jgi:hypothetical protein